MQRNRLIAATSRATIVVEAGWRSGSLNTAGHAHQLGRPVGAVPGPVTSAASTGCHRLLREGAAVCVTTPQEMAELATAEFGGGGPTLEVGDEHPPSARGDSHQRPLPQQSSEATRLLDALSTRVPRPVDDVAARAGLSVGQVQSLIGQLALESIVIERERGWVKSTRPRSDSPNG